MLSGMRTFKAHFFAPKNPNAVVQTVRNFLKIKSRILGVSEKCYCTARRVARQGDPWPLGRACGGNATDERRVAIKQPSPAMLKNRLDKP